MRASLKIPAWVFLIMTTLTAGFAGWIAFGLTTGRIEGQSAGLTFLFVATWLGILGLITIIFGALGIWRSRRLGEHIPMVYKLCLAVSIAALLGGGLFGVYN